MADPLRILCIHGYRQNSSSFRDKTGALRKLLKKQVDMVYISAPHPVPRSDEGVGDGGVEEDPRGWWFSDPKARSFDAGQECEKSLGLQESLEAIQGAVRELGPFDGVLGFSQGAALVAMVCDLQERGSAPDLHFRFVILVSGFRSACAQHQHLYNGSPLSLPSLHVFGCSDRVIPENMSRELLLRFSNPHILNHPGGHFVPATSAHGQVYKDFLQRFRC